MTDVLDHDVPGLTRPSSPGGRPDFLSDVVVELGFASRETVEQAVREARAGTTVSRVLLESGAVTEDQLARATAERHGLDHIDLSAFPVDAGAANLIKPAAARRYQAVPVGFEPDGSLIVAVADPADALGLNDIAVMTKLDVVAAVAAPSAIEELVERLPLGRGGASPAPPRRRLAASAPQSAQDAGPQAVFWQAGTSPTQAPAGPSATPPAPTPIPQGPIPVPPPPAPGDLPPVASTPGSTVSTPTTPAAGAANERPPTPGAPGVITPSASIPAAPDIPTPGSPAPGASEITPSATSAAAPDIPILGSPASRVSEITPSATPNAPDITTPGSPAAGASEAASGAPGVPAGVYVAVLHEELQAERVARESVERRALAAERRLAEVTRSSGDEERRLGDAQATAEEARKRARELADADRRAEHARVALAELREETDRQREQHAQVERELRARVAHEERRRRELEERLSEVEESVFAAERAFDELGLAQRRMRGALRALVEPATVDDE